jgi:hypothetical protein
MPRISPPPKNNPGEQKLCIRMVTAINDLSVWMNGMVWRIELFCNSECYLLKKVNILMEASSISIFCTSDNVWLNLFNCRYSIWTGVLLTSLILIRLFSHSNSMTSWRNITCNVVPFCCNLRLVIQHLVFDRNIWL